MQRTCLSGSPVSQYWRWLMIVSIAIVVLPVDRSPMISWRWPRPIGVIESIALMPVASGSCTDLRAITPGAWSSSARRPSSSMSPRPSIGLPERVDHAAEEVVADRHREDLARAADRLALLDPGEVTEDDDADLAGVEVQGDALGAVLELEQLVGHGRGKAADSRDAVAGLGDPADLLLAGGGRACSPRRTSGARPESPPDESKAPSSLCLFPGFSGVSVVLGAAHARRAGQPASLRWASSSLLATVPSMTSSPISTRIPPTIFGVQHDLQVDRRCRTASRERLGQPARVRRRRAPGRRTPSRSSRRCCAPRCAGTSPARRRWRRVDRRPPARPAASWRAAAFPSNRVRSSSPLSDADRAGSESAVRSPSVWSTT